MASMLISMFLLMNFFGFAGGGGSSSDYSSDGGSYSSGSGYSSGGDSWSSYDYSSNHSSSNGSGTLPIDSKVFIAAFFIVFGAVAIYYLLSSRSSEKELVISAEDRAKIISATGGDFNNTEQEKLIHELAAKVFIDYQTDWSNANIGNIQKYATIGYYEHASLMLQLLENMGRRNVVKDLKLHNTSLLTKVDDSTKLPAKVTIQFKFSGLDTLVEKETDKVIYRDRASGISEYWVFTWDGKELLLDKTCQLTASLSHVKREAEVFAEKNGMYFSADWGVYALPKKGQIFSGTNIHMADVNNHVIGQLKNCIIQMYTFSKTPDVPSSYFLVGQINFSKKYEGIIIRSRAASEMQLSIPCDYEEVELEWNEFNEKYQVFAHSKDVVTTFELLNPHFMAQLSDKNLNYNIEVIDNVLYIFAPVNSTESEDYGEIFDVLSLAFKELKM